jgi:hypothetical protein
MILPLPTGFDASQYAEGESFDVNITVHLTPEGLEVEAIDGVPTETTEAPAEEEVEMDEAALNEAMGRGGMA